MPITHDIVAITGTYQKDGQDKPRYKNVGVIIEKDGKQYVKMESLVTIHDDGHTVNFFSMFEKEARPQNQPAQQPAAAPASVDDFSDDIPFKQPHDEYFG